MQCNIDARGKAARLISGIIVAIIGIALLVFAAMDVLGGSWPWWVGGLAVAAGAFQIYEARAGWCVMRAMGFKTPM
jgi:1,4-dihydroxy-2-naphthoate octaprenyltransferase